MANKPSTETAAALNVNMMQVAADAIASGTETLNNGNAMLTLALVGELETRLHCSYVAVKGDNPTHHSFTLAEYAFPVMTESGKRNSKLRSAQVQVILCDLIGETADKVRPAVATAFQRAFPAAIAIAAIRADMPGAFTMSASGHIDNVPLPVAVDLLDNKGEPTKLREDIASRLQSAAKLAKMTLSDVEIDAQINDLPVCCTGTVDPVFGPLPGTPELLRRLKSWAVDQGIYPAPTGRGANTQDKSPEGLFRAALALVTAAMVAATGTDDEGPEIGFTVEDDAALAKLAGLIAAFAPEA